MVAVGPFSWLQSWRAKVRSAFHPARLSVFAKQPGAFMGQFRLLAAVLQTILQIAWDLENKGGPSNDPEFVSFPPVNGVTENAKAGALGA
jgi:hypothetical protein